MNADRVIEAAAEVRAADQNVTHQSRNGSLHEMAEARMRMRDAMTALDAAFEAE